MTRRNRDTRAILRTIERSEERSPLFWWMVEHHDEMLQSSKGKRIRWSTFCVTAATKGLTDTRGAPPTERNARETWRQARKAVIAAREAEAARPSSRAYPSRFPKDWKPEAFQSASAVAAFPTTTGEGGVVPSPPSRLPIVPVRATDGAPPSRFAKPEDPPEVKQMFADLEEDMRKQDRWMLKE